MVPEGPDIAHALFALIRNVGGLLAAAIGTAMLAASPGFLELSCSVMQEIPALAAAVLALCILLARPYSKCRLTEPMADAVFGLLFI